MPRRIKMGVVRLEITALIQYKYFVSKRKKIKLMLILVQVRLSKG